MKQQPSDRTVVASAPPSCPATEPSSEQESGPSSPIHTKPNCTVSEPPSPGGNRERVISRSRTTSEDEESKAEKIRNMRQSFVSLLFNEK